MADVGVPATSRYYPDYERYIAGVVERSNIEPQYATVEKGRAVIWAANLLHGGARQTDSERTRHSQVTHYFFEGCENFAPLLSSPATWSERVVRRSRSSGGTPSSSDIVSAGTAWA